MKLAFLGTTEFAVPSLNGLLEAGHEVRLVLTQPDRPAGRGRHLHQSPVKRKALAHGLTVFQPEKLDAPSVERIATEEAQAAVVVAYGLILPPSLLRLPPLGCINVHASLLPRYRGAAPVAHAILDGESRTGVTTLLMDAGIDTGPILQQSDCAIGPLETEGELEERLSEMGARLLVATLEEAAAGRLRPRAQEVDRATYAPKIKPEMAWIPWARDPVFITNLVRAMNPRPGAFTSMGASRLKVWRAAAGAARSGDEKRASPGTVLSGVRAPRVACGESGSVILQEIQMEGRRRVTGEEALRGHWFSAGDRFGEATGLGGQAAGPPTTGV